MALIAVAFVAVAVPSPASGASRCSAAGWREIDRSDLVIVQQRRGGVRIRACARRTGRVRAVDRARHGSGGGAYHEVHHLRAVGRLVVWESRGTFNGAAEATVHRLDALSGRRRAFDATTDESATVDVAAPHQVSSLVARGDGVMAWIAENQRAEPARPEAFLVDARGRTLLEAGAGLDRGSLRFAGNTIRWTSSGEARQAEVQAPARAAAAAAKRRPCPRGKRALARNATVIVYRIGENLTVACHLPSGRRTRLGDSGPPDSNSSFTVGPIRVAGRFVAYGLEEWGAQDHYQHVAVLDARSGRRREHVAESEAGLRDLDLRSEVTDLAVTKAGTAVWIISGERPEPEGFELRWARRDDRGSTLVDSGSDIRAGSLALAGTRIYWMKGDAAFTATLPS